MQYDLTCLILQRLGRPEADLSPGMKGTIITTNVLEKRAYQILNEVREALVVFIDGLRLECTSACAGRDNFLPRMLMVPVYK